MEVIIFCVTLTSVVAILLVGIGVCIGGHLKGEYDLDSDIRIYHPSRNREHRGMAGLEEGAKE